MSTAGADVDFLLRAPVAILQGVMVEFVVVKTEDGMYAFYEQRGWKHECMLSPPHPPLVDAHAVSRASDDRVHGRPEFRSSPAVHA